MIVRELITRLGFTMDQRGADQYDRRLRKLREDAEKSAKKTADQEARRLALMARTETAVARLRGTQFKALQETERRENQLEQQRQRGRERAERHQRTMERTRRNDQRAQQRHVQAMSAANARAHDAQMRRTAALRQQQQSADNRQLRAVQVRAHAEQRLANQVSNHHSRQAAATARMAAFQQRQAHMRRAELLREQNILLRNRQIRRQISQGGRGAGSGAGGFLGAGVGLGAGGFGVANVAHRVDEMSTYSTRLNSVLPAEQAASRDAELRRISLLAGVTPSTIGGVAYKTMRAANSLGVEGMNANRAMDVTEAVGLGAALSGSSSEATNAALIQLFQGLESNRLGGEELRSVMEQTPEIARALMKGANYDNLGDFRAASKAGEITGKVMIEALEKVLPELRARAGEIPITFSRTFSQLGTMFNYFLLDMQKGADVTGKFNKAVLSFAGSVERKTREIIANMGGWEVATEKLVAVLAGVAIPVILRLAMTVAAYMGPLALLAAPLTLVFSSLLEFARKYPVEWAEGVSKIKAALSNLIDSVLYAMGMRLKPFDKSGAKEIGRVELQNKGNGVVGFNGQEYQQGSAELFNAIKAAHPELAAQMSDTGGRMRVMQGGKLGAEVQQMPDGKVSASAWPEVLAAAATSIQQTADWFYENKTVFTDIRDNLRTLVELIQRLPGMGVADRASSAGGAIAGGLKVAGGDMSGLKDIGKGFWDLGLPGFLFGNTKEVSDSMSRDEENRQAYANRLLNGPGYGNGGQQTTVKIDRIDVHVKEAATKEAFISAVDSAGKQAIESAMGKSNSRPFVYPMENTSRPTE